jgi:hypothetical protein
MKKIILTLLFLGTFAALFVLTGMLVGPAAASPGAITLTPSPTFCEVCPPPPLIVKTPGSGGGAGGAILPVTGELPPGPGGPGAWILPGIVVLLIAGVAGLALGFKAGDKLRK